MRLILTSYYCKIKRPFAYNNKTKGLAISQNIENNCPGISRIDEQLKAIAQATPLLEKYSIFN